MKKLISVSNISVDELLKEINNIEITPPKVNTAFWVFGDSKEKIKTKFLIYTTNNYFPEIEEKLDEMKETFKQAINTAFSDKEERGKIIKEFNRAVIEPIGKTLKEKDNQLKEFKEKIEEDKNRFNELNKELERLTEIKKFIEKELK